MISLDMEWDDQLADAFGRAAGRAGDTADKAAYDTARYVEDVVVARSRRLTGALAGGWQTEKTERGEYVVGNLLPYARRQELGFTGPDSRGRVYKTMTGTFAMGQVMEGADAKTVLMGSLERDLAADW